MDINTDIFLDITPDEAVNLSEQFKSEMARILRTSKPGRVYQALNLSRETGRKYQFGKIPTKRPADLRRLLLNAISKLGFKLDYRGNTLTPELLGAVTEQPKQLDLFSLDGIEFEIIRKRTPRSISLELLIREA